MSYVVAFVLAACWNAVFARYSCALAARSAYRCAGWAATMSAIGGVQVLIYTNVHAALIAQVIGAGVGAFLGVVTHGKANPNQSQRVAGRAA